MHGGHSRDCYFAEQRSGQAKKMGRGEGRKKEMLAKQVP